MQDDAAQAPVESGLRFLERRRAEAQLAESPERTFRLQLEQSRATFHERRGKRRHRNLLHRFEQRCVERQSLARRRRSGLCEFRCIGGQERRLVDLGVILELWRRQNERIGSRRASKR